MNSYAEPWSVLVPDLVLRLITPPANRPYSGPRLLVWTLNSSMASCVGITVTTFKYAPLVGVPSMRIWLCPDMPPPTGKSQRANGFALTGLLISEVRAEDRQ